MLYKLLHKLFGWDYIYWRNFADQGVARVYHSKHYPVVYYWRYRATKVLDIIHKPLDVTWLTCHPEKYFPDV